MGIDWEHTASMKSINGGVAFIITFQSRHSVYKVHYRLFKQTDPNNPFDYRTIVINENVDNGSSLDEINIVNEFIAELEDMTTVLLYTEIERNSGDKSGFQYKTSCFYLKPSTITITRLMNSDSSLTFNARSYDNINWYSITGVVYNSDVFTLNKEFQVRTGTNAAYAFTGVASTNTANAGVIMVKLTKPVTFPTTTSTITNYHSRYTYEYVAGTLDTFNVYTILPKELTVSGTGTTTIGGKLSGITAGSLSEKIANTDVTLVQGANLEGTKVINALTGTDQANYYIANPVETINPTANNIAITITAIPSKTQYDGTDYDSFVSYLVSGLVGSDTVTSVTKSFKSTTNQIVSGIAQAGTYTAILSAAVYGSNTYVYTATYVDRSIVVNKKSLTITSSSSTSTYDGTSTYRTLLSNTAFTHVGLVSSDSITITQEYKVNNSVVTGTAQAGVFIATPSASFSSGSASNYDITYVSSTNVVNEKPLTITSSSSTSTYDGKTYSQLVPDSSFVAVGVVNDEPITITQTFSSASTIAKAGRFTATPSIKAFATSANYTITYVPSFNTVNPKQLTISNTAIQSKVYDGKTVATVTGGTLSGIIGSEIVNLVQSGVYASSDVGTKTVTVTNTLTGTDKDNYTVLSETVSGSITKQPVTVINTLPPSKTYDGTTPATVVGGTIIGNLSGEPVTVTQTGVYDVANAGPRTVTVTNTIDNANYSLTNETFTISGTINKKPVTVTPNNITTTYGNDLPLLTQSLSEFFEPTRLPTGWPTYGISIATKYSHAGRVPIHANVEGLSAPNYSFVEGTSSILTISPAPLTLKPTNYTTIVDGNSVDLNLVFQPIGQNVPHYKTGLIADNVDLGNLFADLSTGEPIGFETKWTVHGNLMVQGKDLCNFFAKYVASDWDI